MLIAGILVSQLLYSQQWKSFGDSAKVYSEKNNYEKAASFYSLAIDELKKDSAESSTIVEYYQALGESWLDARKFANVEPALQSAGSILKKKGLDTTLAYVRVLNALGINFYLQNQLDKVEEKWLMVRTLREKLLGKEHLDYIKICNNLGALYGRAGMYDEAQRYNLEVLELRKKLLGKDHPDYATSNSVIATTYYHQGLYSKAMPYGIEAVQLRHKLLGKEHLDYAHAATLLGAIYVESSVYDKAEPLYQDARTVYEKQYGKKNINYANICNNLGQLYRNTGNLELSEQMHLEALQLREQLFGKEHEEYALSCNNLGILYYKMGMYPKSEDFLLRARAIRIKLLKKDHPDIARNSEALADIYMYTDQFDKAEQMLKEALQINANAYGRSHITYASSANNLANLYLNTGKYKLAEPLYLESMEIREKVWGTNHSDYANSCNNIGVFYMKAGEYGKAENYFDKAAKSLVAISGSETMDYVRVEMNRALSFWNAKDTVKAGKYFAEAYNIVSRLATQHFQFTSEEEKQAYLEAIIPFDRYFLSFVTSMQARDFFGMAYDVILSNRHLILTSLQQLKQAANSTTDETFRKTYQEWTALKEKLGADYSSTARAKSDELKQLEEKAVKLEKTLAKYSTSFERQLSQAVTGWKKIQETLGPEEAAIEFSVFHHYTGTRDADSLFYTAWVIRKGASSPTLVSLFEQRELDSLLKYKSTSPEQHLLNLIYTRSIGRSDKRLYHLIWQPLEKELGGIKTVYYSPAGGLHKISFAALSPNDSSFLSDHLKLVQLNTTSTVVAGMHNQIKEGGKLVVYGGIQYDADSVLIRNAVLKTGYQDIATRSMLTGITREGAAEFDYLPATVNEVAALAEIAKSKKYRLSAFQNIDATEETFKMLNGAESPVILHFATHGFFFPDPKRNKIKSSTGTAFIQATNPLIRSGLAMAGANNAWKGNPVRGIEDGILTAYEIANMYLPNTKLAILSACETGLGDIQGNEGVYGLQRAFKIAGVENLIMSLWQVNDVATAEFMMAFYKELFRTSDIAVSFYYAQNSMKEKYRSDPYKWAAWILVR